MSGRTQGELSGPPNPEIQEPLAQRKAPLVLSHTLRGMAENEEGGPDGVPDHGV